jgi:hypothetical protein
MDEEAYRASVARTIDELQGLSRRHYREDLAAILGHAEEPLARRQYARLIGVLIKEPFADEHMRAPSKSTKASIGLRWKDDAELRRIAPETWQFAFMRELNGEVRGRPVNDSEAFGQLTYYKYESSLGKFVFEAFRDRICGDPRATKVVRHAIAQAKHAGIRLTDPTVTSLTVGVASSISVAIAGFLSPALAAVAAPVVGGLSLLMMQVGVDGFCRWSKAVIEESESVEDGDERS